jgi:hypothetical protein
MYCATRLVITCQPASTTITFTRWLALLGSIAGQQNKPHGNTIHAKVVIHLEGINPGGQLDKLHVSCTGIEARVERNSDNKTGNRTQQSQPAGEGGTIITSQSQHQQASDDRYENRQR